jgi:hypothetical protein
MPAHELGHPVAVDVGDSVWAREAVVGYAPEAPATSVEIAAAVTDVGRAVELEQDALNEDVEDSVAVHVSQAAPAAGGSPAAGGG